MQCKSNSESSIKDKINSIDFNFLIKRMVKIHYWTYPQTIEGLDQYKSFLFLKKKYGDKYILPPSVDIDEIWHNHILHTKRYEKDCNIIFGKYLHHTPHHGENEEISNKKLKFLFENETQSLHFKEFGDYIYQVKRMPFYKKIDLFLKKLLNFSNFKKINKLKHSLIL